MIDQWGHFIEATSQLISLNDGDLLIVQLRGHLSDKLVATIREKIEAIIEPTGKRIQILIHDEESEFSVVPGGNA